MSGRILELEEERYHADEVGFELPSLSASIAHVLCSQSPRHAWAQHPKLDPAYRAPEPEARFDVGNVAHAAILEGADIAVPVAFNDWRSNAAKAARDEIRAAGRIPLLAEQYRELTRMLSAIYLQLSQHRAKPAPFYGGAAERVAVWTEADVACRARIDYLHEDLTAIDDLKTTSRSADPRVYAKNLYANGGDVQAVFYRRAIAHIYGCDPPAFRWIVVETHPPYALSVIEPAGDVLALGEAKVDYALEEWARLLELEGEWPAYPLDVVRAELPPWEETRWLERMEAV